MADKKARSYSLSKVNREWLNARAKALSTDEKVMSASAFLDNLVTAKREEVERAARILKQLEGKRK